jgi:hypothetical protein
MRKILIVIYILVGAVKLNAQLAVPSLNIRGRNIKIDAGTYNNSYINSVQLAGIVIGQDSLKWFSTGSGNFNNSKIVNPIYTFSELDKANETVILKMASYYHFNTVLDTIWAEREISCFVQPTAIVGKDFWSCGKDLIALTATYNYSDSSKWTSSGTGIFNNIHTATTYYTPSNPDTTAGKITFTFTNYFHGYSANSQVIVHISSKDSAVYSYGNLTKGYTYRIDFNGYWTTYHWNKITNPAISSTTTLKDSASWVSRSMTIKVPHFNADGSLGYNSTNNSCAFPDSVNRTYLSCGTSYMRIVFKNCTSKQTDIIITGSRITNANSTRYRINNDSITINNQNNCSSTANFSIIDPVGDSIVLLVKAVGAGNVGYLNGIIIRESDYSLNTSYVCNWRDTVQQYIPPQPADNSAIRIFPSAVGYGSQSFGAYEKYRKTLSIGDLPKILYVNTLNGGNFSTSDSSGTLKWCLAQNYPRIVLFTVGGLINWRSNSTDPIGGIGRGYNFTVRNPFCNVYGQSAPYPGITITNGGLLFVQNHDWLIQNLKIRINDSIQHEETKCITGWSGNYNIVIDHCSFSWTIDQLIGFNPASKITVSNCILAEPFNHNTHPNAPSDAYHAMFTTFLNTDSVSFVANAFIHGLMRAPMVGSQTNYYYIANNLMYNIKQNAVFAGLNGVTETKNRQVDIINNYYKIGRSTVSYGKYLLQTASGIPVNSNFYLSGNRHPLTTDQTGTLMVSLGAPFPIVQSTIPNTSPQGYTPISAILVPGSIQSNCGAFYWKRDSTDIRVLKDVTDSTGLVKDFSTDIPGGTHLNITPTSHTLSLPANPNGDSDNDGYTNIQEWVNALKPE